MPILLKAWLYLGNLFSMIVATILHNMYMMRTTVQVTKLGSKK